jgi:hypothetical protein
MLRPFQQAVAGMVSIVPVAFSFDFFVTFLPIGNKMKFSALIAVLFALTLSACGQKPAAPTAAPTIAVPAMVAEAASGVAAAASGVAAAASGVAAAASGVAAVAASGVAAVAAPVAAVVAPAKK